MDAFSTNHFVFDLD
jgi:hypothetical protein